MQVDAAIQAVAEYGIVESQHYQEALGEVPVPRLRAKQRRVTTQHVEHVEVVGRQRELLVVVAVDKDADVQREHTHRQVVYNPPQMHQLVVAHRRCDLRDERVDNEQRNPHSYTGRSDVHGDNCQGCRKIQSE